MTAVRLVTATIWLAGAISVVGQEPRHERLPVFAYVELIRGVEDDALRSAGFSADETVEVVDLLGGEQFDAMVASPRVVNELVEQLRIAPGHCRSYAPVFGHEFQVRCSVWLPRRLIPLSGCLDSTRPVPGAWEACAPDAPNRAPEPAEEWPASVESSTTLEDPRQPQTHEPRTSGARAGLVGVRERAATHWSDLLKGEFDTCGVAGNPDSIALMDLQLDRQPDGFELHGLLHGLAWEGAPKRRLSVRTYLPDGATLFVQLDRASEVQSSPTLLAVTASYNDREFRPSSAPGIHGRLVGQVVESEHEVIMTVYRFEIPRHAIGDLDLPGSPWGPSRSGTGSGSYEPVHAALLSSADLRALAMRVGDHADVAATEPEAVRLRVGERGLLEQGREFPWTIHVRAALVAGEVRATLAWQGEPRTGRTFGWADSVEGLALTVEPVDLGAHVRVTLAAFAPAATRP